MTTSIAIRLALLNTLRADAGEPALVSWKNSSDELDQRIKDMTPAPTVVTTSAPEPHLPTIAEALKAGVAITKVPTGATSKKPTKDLDKRAAKKAAKVDKLVTKAQPPTSTSPSVTRTKVKTGKGKHVTIERTSTPKSGNEFGAYLAANKLDPKQARATLRRKGFSAPYALTAELKAALATDARKK